MPAAGESAPLRLPPMCGSCQARRVAWTRPRVDVCYDCLPGGPFTPPACSACGTDQDYFSQGLCGRCHPRSPLHVGSCKICLAWGVYPRHNWTCWACRWWRANCPEQTCQYCGRLTRVGDQGACRLCLSQAQRLQEPGRSRDLAAANRHGQQLFFANILIKRHKTPRLRADPWRARSRNSLPFADGTGFMDHVPEQLTLFDLAPDPEVVRALAAVADSDLTRYCASIVDEHAARFGWSARQRNDVIRSLRLLQTLRTTPTAKIRVGEVLMLPRYQGNITSTMDVLRQAGLLIEDQPSPLRAYLSTRTADLPPQMVQHLELWLDIMVHGSRTAPRQLPREPQTVRLHLDGVTPAVTTWAQAGYRSFAEVTPEDVKAAVTAQTGARRRFAETGLKSLFKVLHGRKLIFTNPARRLPTTQIRANTPMPLDPATVRQELNSPDPAVALCVALVAFHGLTPKELRFLKLTDIADGSLTLHERVLPLAAPVRSRLAAWLDHRQRTWPETANPHLLINRKTAPRLTPPGPAWPWTRTALRPQALREDRILHELHVTGDLRRICDLFGLSVQGATRYLTTIEHPDLTINSPRD